MKKILSILICLCMTISFSNECVFADKDNVNKVVSYSVSLLTSTVANTFACVKGVVGGFFKGASSAMGMAFAYVVPILLISKISEMYGNYKLTSTYGKIERPVDTIETAERFDEAFRDVVGQEKQKEQLKAIIMSHVDELRKRNLGISKDKGALCIYMIGASGVGKSISAYAICKVLCGDNCVPVIFEPSDIDIDSKKSSPCEQIFGMRSKKLNNSEYYELSTLLLHIKNNPGSVVILNEWDKFGDKKTLHILEEKLRTIVDQGYVKVNGEIIDCSGTTFIVTSNESVGSITKGMHEDDGTGSRTYVEHDKAFLNRMNFVVFDNLGFDDYLKITKIPCDDLKNYYLNHYGFDMEFGNCIQEIAKLTTNLNQGARPIKRFVDKLNDKVLREVIIKNCKTRSYIGKSYKITFDENSEDFIVSEVISEDNTLKKSEAKENMNLEKAKDVSSKENFDASKTGFSSDDINEKSASIPNKNEM